MRLELGALLLVTWLAFMALPWSVGGVRLSWDALNHHIYLGWSAAGHRLDQDFMAAGYQSLTFPYLYWPVYKLALAGASGITAGLVLATLHLVAVPPVWMIARTCIPATDWYGFGMRALALAGAAGQAIAMKQTGDYESAIRALRRTGSLYDSAAIGIWLAFAGFAVLAVGGLLTWRERSGVRG